MQIPPYQGLGGMFAQAAIIRQQPWSVGVVVLKRPNFTCKIDAHINAVRSA